ncbi:Acetate--CoA ligase [Lentibacillus sp. JNUCC-1]|uniref:acetate--CoA ligase n=1 Tax=Lentibacillus sp. JNUCC-1 TaxID=2654513 RepID=UPI0012E7748F|nr:acetate--CoA ligase [Lentibacillus sp. JNUCC-1]MUV37026.1 Acetate--CoA ligase [Lentibacillus sp. JNUCC-1]
MQAESGGIHDIIKSSRVIYPDQEKQAATELGSSDAFQALLKESQEDPAAFWEKVASELHWFKPWEETISGSLPDFEFFKGGISNPCYNLLDRHIENGAGNRTALIWEGEEGATRFYTYNMLLAEVNRFSNVLQSKGVGKGDPVAIYLPNLAESFIAILTCFRVGAVYSTVFSGFSEQSLYDRLSNYEPKLVITADAGLRRGKVIPLKEKMDRVADRIPSVESVVVVDRLGTEPSMKTGRDVWWHEELQKASIHFDPVHVEANEPGIVFYTSGTTGKPKGVVHAGMAFVVQNYIYAKYHMNHQPDDVFWCTADVGWLTMHIWGVVGSLANGVTTVVYDGAPNYPESDRFYQIIDKYRINKLFTAPTALRMLRSLGEKALEPYNLSCLDVVSLVGEPFDPDTWHWTRDVLGNGNIYVNNTWGQTETAGCPLAGAAWLSPMKPGSAGAQFLGADVGIVDNEGNDPPQGTIGNLVIRKPFPMLCRTLWKEPDRYYEKYFSQVEGCYYASDIAIEDEDGFFWVIGRSDDAFNVSGHRLSTMEIENAVLGCAGVSEAAVIGAPDEIKGEVPVVFATISDGYTANEDLKQTIENGIIQAVGQLARPRDIFFVEAMPKTVSGKIMRRLLKEVQLKGSVDGDVTGLEDPSAIDHVREIVTDKQV